MNNVKEIRTLKDAKYHICEQCSSYCVCKKKGDDYIQKCPKCSMFMTGSECDVL